MNIKAVHYFYPDGFWGGYVRFFNPCIPSRVGDAFIHSVKRALQGDRKHLLSALFILQSVHLKKVNKAGDKPPFREIQCFPTEEAKVAIHLLSESLPEPTNNKKPKQ